MYEKIFVWFQIISVKAKIAAKSFIASVPGGLLVFPDAEVVHDVVGDGGEVRALRLAESDDGSWFNKRNSTY